MDWEMFLREAKDFDCFLKERIITPSEIWEMDWLSTLSPWDSFHSRKMAARPLKMSLILFDFASDFSSDN